MGRGLSEELKRLRQAKGLSLRALAQAVGVPHTTYANYERGVAVPPPERRDALAKALDIPRRSIDDLIEEDQYDVFLRARPLSAEGKQAVRDFLRLVRQRERERQRRGPSS